VIMTDVGNVPSEPDPKDSINLDAVPEQGYVKEGSEMVVYVSTPNPKEKLVVGPLLETEASKRCWQKIQNSILGYIGAKVEPGYSNIIFPFQGAWETVADENGNVFHESARTIWFTRFAVDWGETISYLLALGKAQELFIEAAVNSINPTNIVFRIEKQYPFFGLNGRCDNPGVWFVMATCNFPVPAGVWDGFLDLLDIAAFENELDFEQRGGFTFRQWESVTKSMKPKGRPNDNK